MDGVALAARFSLPTNRRQFCGPSEAPPLLYRAATEGAGLAEARSALLRFEALEPYLRALGERHGLDPLDARVVEAYWIGNDLLDGFGAAAFRSLIDRLVARGLPARIGERLKTHVPAEAIPHHLFHVAYVGVGAVTGHVPTTLPNMEACRPASLTVRERAGDRLRLEGPALRVGPSGSLSLDGTRSGWVDWDRALVPDPRPGDAVAVHWGTPVMALAPEQAAALAAYGARALAAANAALPSLGVRFVEGTAPGTA